MSNLTVLSVRQPWASLLLTGEDWSENRTWKTDYRGPLWIHASSTTDREECELHRLDPSQFTTGAILGCVELKDIIEFEPNDPGREVLEFETIDQYGLHPFGLDFLVGPYGWIVTDPKPLKEPIPAKGQLRLWNYEVNEEWRPQFCNPAPLLDWSAPTEYETYREEITVGNEKERVIFRQENGPVAMYYMDRRRKHIAMPKSSVQYKQKSAYYKAGCERAWELFPEKFK